MVRHTPSAAAHLGRSPVCVLHIEPVCRCYSQSLSTLADWLGACFQMLEIQSVLQGLHLDLEGCRHTKIVYDYDNLALSNQSWRVTYHAQHRQLSAHASLHSELQLCHEGPFG